MTTNTKEYLAQIAKHQETILKSVSTIINESNKELFKKIVERTPEGNPSLWKYPAPKDYAPGTLKASWGISYNTNGSIRGSNGQFTSLSEGGLKFSLKSTTPQGVTIYNNQPYAERVEMGWSTQAPSGMMRISAQEYGIIIDKNARRYKTK